MKFLTPARLSLFMFLIVGGLIAAYIAKGLLAVDERRPPESLTRNVPMAISDLPAGTLITEAHLGIGPSLKTKITRDVLLNNKSIVGRVAKEAIKAAEPIVSSQLYERGVYPPLKLSEGMRAVTISLSGTAILDGMVRPGQYVDVHFSPTAMQGDPRLRGGMTMTLFRGVKILAINRSVTQSGVGGNQNSENAVTLEMSEGEENIILVAREKGTLYCSYNPNGAGENNRELSNKDRVTLEEILGLEPLPKPEQPIVQRPFVTQVYRGSTMSQNSFIKVGDKMMLQNGAGNMSPTTATNNNGGNDSSRSNPPEPDILPSPSSIPPEPAPPLNSDDDPGRSARLPPERPL